jgi:hypothetical protein
MILSEKIIAKYHNFLTKESKKIEKKFYLIANNTKILDYSFLNNTNFFDENSICILFNNAYPLTINEQIKNHGNKWIFFRSLSMIQNETYYRDLSLLQNYFFEKYYFIPEILDSIKYKNKDYFWSTISYLKEKNISLSELHHMDIFESEEFRIVRKYYSRIKKTISSGLWVYIYIKNKYPRSEITLVGYDLCVNSAFHDVSFEYGYILSDILSNRCKQIKCLDLD